MAGTDRSTLEIEVVSKGISEASKALGGLGRSAETTEKKVDKLTSTLTKLMNVQSSAIQQATQHGNLMSAIAQAMVQVSTSAAATSRAVQSLTANMGNLDSAVSRSNVALAEKAKRAGVVNTTLRAMATAAAAYFGINFAVGIVKEADAWGMMQAKLNIATGSMNNARAVQADLFDLAQKLRSPLEDMGRLYTRLADPLRKMGKTSKDTMEMVEGVALALKLSGATAAEASSVMLQFSQSMNAGRLNGAEFNAVAEGAPIILKALEAQTGKTRGELKKMGADGQISVELIQKAMAGALPKWREDFNKLPLTVDGALTRLKNAWFKAMGEMNEETGLNKGLSDTVRVIEDLIPKIRDEMVAAFVAVGKWINENKDGIAQVWNQTKSLVKDVFNLVGAFFRMVGATSDAANGMEVLASSIFGIRLLLAGAVDLVKLIGASFVNVGADIVDTLVFPLRIIVMGFQKVNELASDLWSNIAKGARAIGMGGLADKIEYAAGSFNRMSNDASLFDNKLKNLTSGARNLADGMLEGWKTGKTEVQKVLDGEEQINAAIKERATYNEVLPLGKPSKPIDEKAAKAAAKELKEYQAVMDRLNNSLKEQIELNARMTENGLNYDKLGQGAKAEIEIQTKLQKLSEQKSTTLNETIKRHLLEELAVAGKLKTMEALNENLKEGLQLEAEQSGKMERNISSTVEETRALEYKAKTFGMTKGAVEALEIAELEEQASAIRGLAELDPFYANRLSQIERLIEAKQRQGQAQEALDALEKDKAATDHLNKFLDPKKAEDFGRELKNAFGEAGNALAQLTNALQDYVTTQSEAAKGRAMLADIKDEKKRADFLDKLNEKQAKESVAVYAQMSGAAKGFFKENSKGYKALEAAEKTFRAFEMAMALQAFVKKTFFANAEATTAIAGNEAKLISQETSTAETIGLALEEAQAKASVAVVNQGSGDPYSAFVRIAAMAALMASLGFAVGGGGGGSVDVAKQRQESQGTGTVLGDSSAKSESISKSLELLRENSDVGLEHSSGMLEALRNIESAMGGLANMVFRTFGLTSGKNFGNFEGVLSKNKGDPILGMLGFNDSFLTKNLPGLGGVIGTLQGLWGKTTQKVVDSGLAINGSVADLTAGRGVQQYVDVEKTKSSMFGLKKKTSRETQYGAVGDELAQQFGMIFSGVNDALVSAAGSLGGNSKVVEDALKNFIVNIPRASLKDLKGEELQQALNAIISTASDEMAKAVLPGLDDFQKVGEGYFETVVRVANGVEQAKYYLDQLSISVIDFKDVTNKQGDVAAEIVRDSLAASEAGSTVADMIKEIDGSATDLIGVYKALIDIRSNLRLTGVSDDISREMIRGAGGLDSLQNALNDYIDGMFSEQEKQAMKVEKLKDEFGKLNLTMPSTAAGFRALVEQLAASGAEGQELAGRVLLLSGAFTELQQVTEDRINSARDDLQESYNREASALQNLKEKFENFGKSLRDFKDSLLTGNLSPLTTGEKYAQVASKFNDTITKAKAGDQDAIANFQKVANEFLQVSREYNASGSAYTSDFNLVMTETQALAEYSDQQVNIAQASLEALNQQVEGLITINDSVLSVEQAIVNLYAAMTSNSGTTGGASEALVSSLYRILLNRDADATGLSYYTSLLQQGKSYDEVRGMILESNGSVDGSHADGLSYVPFDGYKAELHKGEAVLTAQENRMRQMNLGEYGRKSDEALCNEIKALREEVKQLRQEQNDQTNRLIGSNYDANERNAQAVVEGTRDAMSETAWKEKNRLEIV